MSVNGRLKQVGIVGTGSYLPKQVLTNTDLEQMLDTTDEWIRTRTGIRERHMAGVDEASSDLGAIAAKCALEDSGINPSEIDVIIVATVTPDMPFPCTACFVQQKIGAKNAFCFDIEAACSGFVYALDIGYRYLASGGGKNALVIGAEKLSGVTDWKDRATCVLFGDGAGAVILQSETTGRGILGTVAGSDGGLADLLSIPGGGSRNPINASNLSTGLQYLKMAGNEVFKHAIRCMCDVSIKVLKQCDVSISDVDWIIPHQANFRILQAIAQRLGASMDKVIINLENVGNMSGASVPVALDEAARSGKLRTGDIILFIAFGGGFTWGASLVEWSDGS